MSLLHYTTPTCGQFLLPNQLSLACSGIKYLLLLRFLPVIDQSFSSVHFSPRGSHKHSAHSSRSILHRNCTHDAVERLIQDTVFPRNAKDPSTVFTETYSKRIILIHHRFVEHLSSSGKLCDVHLRRSLPTSHPDLCSA